MANDAIEAIHVLGRVPYCIINNPLYGHENSQSRHCVAGLEVVGKSSIKLVMMDER